MADTGLTLNAGSGGSDLNVDQDANSRLHQYVKVEFGASGTQTPVSSSNPLPVDASGAAVPVTDNGSTLSIDDGSGSITVDWAGTAPPIGAGLEATALRVTLATDSTGVVSVDDNGGSLTVDLATLPDTASGDLAAINAALAGSLTVGSHAVTNAGTFAVQEDGAALTALQLIDDSIFADDGAFTLASSKVTMAGAIRDDALSTLTAVEGDAVPLRVSSTGALHVTGGGGGTEYTDDTDTHATGSSVGNLLMAAATPTDGSVDANDIGAVAMSTDRRLHTDTQIVGQDADLTIADGGNSITVDWNGTAPPIGAGTEAAALRVTLATDSTGVVSVDDGGGALTVDNGGTFAVQVDAALPAGTNAIGKLAANSGVDIGDVDVTSVTPGTAAGNLGKAEDAAHTSGDTGVMALAVRQDASAALAGTTGDYAPLSVGELGHLRAGCIAESQYRNIDANAEAAIKATPGILHWIHVINLTASLAYLHLYNATTATVTPGTTTPNFTFPIPTLATTNGAGFNIKLDQLFDTAITLVCTTTTDGSTGDPGTNGVMVNAGYT